jgi:hypothetical protein
MGECSPHERLQVVALPVCGSSVHGSLSSQVRHFVPLLSSQVSPGSMTPLPQGGAQSESLEFLQLDGQQPSPP